MDGWAPASVNTETPNPADDGDGEAEEDLVAISQAGTPLKLNVPAHSSLDFGVSRDPSPAFSQSNVVIDDASFVPKPSTGASRAAQRSKDACPGRVRAVVLYCVLAATLFADQNVISPNMTMIGKEFGMKKEDIDLKLGGYVSFAFFVVGAPATLIVRQQAFPAESFPLHLPTTVLMMQMTAGYLTNCMNRQRLLLWLVLLGEAPSVLTYWVTQFWQLLALRMMSGISLGGALPVMYSLLGDFFPASQRSSVVAALIISTGAGQLVGPSVAGFLGPVIGWRWPFVIVALPALLAVGLVCLLTKEPPRGAAEPALQSVEGAVGVVTERITLAKVRRMLAIRTNALVFIQGLPGCLPWGFLSRFMVDFLHQDRGVSQAYATTLMVLLGLGAVTGVVLGGLAGQRLYNRQRSWMGVFSGFCVLAGLPPLLVLVNADMQELGRVLPLATSMALGFVASLGNPNLKSMVLNVNEPEARGIAMAVQTMLDDVSKGLAPLGVGILSKMMGRQTAFNIAALGWIPCSLLILGTGLTLAPDEDAMQARLADALALQMASLPPRTDAHGAALATDDESRSLLLNGSASHAPHGVLKLQPLAAEPVSLRNSSLRGV